MNLSDVESFCDDIGKPRGKPNKGRKRQLFMAIGSLCVFFLFGSIMALPLFNGRSGLDVIDEFVSGEDLIADVVGDEPPAEDIPEPYLYEHFVPPSNSFGMGETTFKTVNWSYFKQLFTDHCDWVLQYKRYESSDWTDGNEYMTIEKTWNETVSGWKFNLILDAPVDVYSARFVFACDLPVLDYVERDGWQVNLNYTVPGTEEVYNCFFNWSDMASIPGIVFNKGRTDDRFWFSFKKEGGINAGHYEFDPTFGEATTGTNTIVFFNDGVGSAWDSYMFGLEGVPDSSGTADNITVYFYDNPQSLSYSGALYTYTDDDTDYAGALIQTTESKQVSTTGNISFEFNNPKPSITADTSYYICIKVDTYAENYDGNVLSYRFNPSGVGAFKKKGNAEIFLWDDPLTDEESLFLGRCIQIYCSYTEGGGEPPAPPDNPPTIETNFTDAQTTGIGLNCSNFWFNDTEGDIAFNWINASNGQSWSVNESNVTGYIVFSGLDYSTQYWINCSSGDGNNETFLNLSFNTTTEPSSWQQIVDWNLTISNQSSYQQLSEWNLTISNSSSWSTLSTWGLTISNTSNSWNQQEEWNLTISNTSNSFNQISEWNLTISNQSSWSQLQEWNLTISNVTATWKQIVEWNLTITNATGGTWQQLSEWNLTISNTSAYQTVTTWNLTITNSSSSWTQQTEWNLTISNSTPLINIVITLENPTNNSNIPIVIPSIYFTIESLDGSDMNYTIYWGENQDNLTTNISYGNLINNGTYYDSFTNASNYGTTYYWSVNATDGTIWVNETYSFTTRREGIIQIGDNRGTNYYPLGLMAVIPFLILFLRRRKREDE